MEERKQPGMAHKNEQQESSKRPKGFRIGKNKPGASQSVYLGKAEKIKKTLIHKAKLKKQRAKELAKAGYTTEPAPSGTTSSHIGERDEEEQTTSSHVDPPPRRRPKTIPHQRPNGETSPATTLSPDHASSSRHHVSSQKPEQNLSSNTLPSSKSLLNNPKNLNRAPKTKIQHANGQPKMSHRVSKILCKLEQEKVLQSQ
ncbi:hypothetical protein VP01_173g6 [Puccinia sorghi]|uniref:rRNA-processing protein FYV7 n=1 Tax=Puccinia sorghi TaxID=27349 RepID=A0A0L6VF88_9BASI|nr:hypothetical protein VP01_173g6 [Puccinia sorghi]